MEELISVIVPVYNVEAYIEECLDSLSGQTYKNLEFILVDDGSTDTSGKHCDAYAAKDPRFLVIHQDNKGVLAAKTAGIEKAKGSFIGFVDSDDWIAEDTYEKLYDRLLTDGAEIAVCQKYICNEYSGSGYAEISVLEEGPYSGSRLEKIWENLFFQKDYLGEGVSLNLCDKLFKRELILQNYRKVDTRLHYFEDISLALFCILKARCISVCSEALYYYRQRSNSLCHSIDSAYLEQVNIFYQQMYPAVVQYSDKILPRFCAYITDRALHGLNDKMGLNLKQGIPCYLPPFGRILFSDRVVLYGAGEVGKSYYRMFQIARAGQPALWVDRQYAYLQSIGMPVNPVSSLEHELFDKILIAVKFRKNADAIRDDLIKMGIPSEKIVWECPRLLIEP